MRLWVEERGLPLNPGKVIVPRSDLDVQLDLLAERGRANGAEVEFWDADQLHELIRKPERQVVELCGAQVLL